MASLARLGWNDFFQQQVTGEIAHLRMARIVEAQRALYRVAGDFEGWAEISGRFRHDARAAADFPAVGDWVAVAAEPGVDRAVIHRRLERRSTVSRKAAGRTTDEQILAANVDTIFLVTALSRDLNPRRIERYLTLVREAGATPVVLLNKADLSQDPAGEAAALRERLPLVDVLTVSALKSEGFDELGPYLQPAQTVALLGSSGVGKSTLINRLAGHDLLKVGAISETDEKGRHTTTSRQLVELPGGALLIDTPGMRELQPWIKAASGVGRWGPTSERRGAGRGSPRLSKDLSTVDETFEDIADLARECRFTDCAHVAEPGCAVLRAVETGRLDADRLENYRHLLREAAFEERKRDKSAAAEEKRRWKKIHQAAKAMYKDRDRQ